LCKDSMMMQSRKPSNSDLTVFQHVVDPTRVRTIADKNSAVAPLDLRPTVADQAFKGNSIDSGAWSATPVTIRGGNRHTPEADVVEARRRYGDRVCDRELPSSAGGLILSPAAEYPGKLLGARLFAWQK
jgi:hypothetical protein